MTEQTHAGSSAQYGTITTGALTIGDVCRYRDALAADYDDWPPELPHFPLKTRHRLHRSLQAWLDTTPTEAIERWLENPTSALTVKYRLLQLRANNSRVQLPLLKGLRRGIHTKPHFLATHTRTNRPQLLLLALLALNLAVFDSPRRVFDTEFARDCVAAAAAEHAMAALGDGGWAAHVNALNARYLRAVGGRRALCEQRCCAAGAWIARLTKECKVPLTAVVRAVVDVKSKCGIGDGEIDVEVAAYAAVWRLGEERGSVHAGAIAAFAVATAMACTHPQRALPGKIAAQLGVDAAEARSFGRFLRAQIHP